MVFAAALFLAVNSFFLVNWQKEIKITKLEAEEAARPAEIKITALTASDCPECFNLDSLLAALKKNSQLNIIEERTIDYNSEEGSSLTVKYNFAKLPALIIEGETEKALNNAAFLNNFGKMSQGVFILDKLPPPYLEKATGLVRGRYTLTYLTDNSCSECYDVTLHGRILEQGLSARPFEQRTVDRSSSDGRKLLADYLIEKLPTIILTGDMAEYQTLSQAWPQVGTVEEDGTYVFRATEVMGTYFDLKTGKVVTAEK